MRYAIISNPVSGSMSVDQKRSALAAAAAILDAEIHGLDTLNADEFAQCARELVTRCDVLVTAGGDGTFSDIINTVDTSRTLVAYLPLGTGNAMQYALEYRGSLAAVAMRIREGGVLEYDLVDCDEKKRAFMVSVGIDATIIQLRNKYAAQNAASFKAYFLATCNAYLKEYKRSSATIAVDGTCFEVQNLLSLMVVKQPYYGFGMKVVPGARFDDRQLHILCLNPGLLKFVFGGVTALAGGNRVGQYCTGRRVSVELERPLVLQVDGNEAWEADAFKFTVLPKALKIKC